jgi:flagella basal body P-ring formation protein FlgA
VYRIKSPLEEYERAVKEDLLAKSNGYLPEPEEVPARVSRRNLITLPILQPA